MQVSDTQVFGSKIVNETRFQYLRELDSQLPVTTTPAVNVLGAFTTGGNSQGKIIDHQNHYELQNYTSLVHGNHIFKFGGRLRALHDSAFPNLDSTAPSFFRLWIRRKTLRRIPIATLPPIPRPPVRSRINMLCSNWRSRGERLTPPSFRLPAACPMLTSPRYDAGLYAQDDWRVAAEHYAQCGPAF